MVWPGGLTTFVGLCAADRPAQGSKWARSASVEVSSRRTSVLRRGCQSLSTALANISSSVAASVEVELSTIVLSAGCVLEALIVRRATMVRTRQTELDPKAPVCSQRIWSAGRDRYPRREASADHVLTAMRWLLPSALVSKVVAQRARGGGGASCVSHESAGLANVDIHPMGTTPGSHQLLDPLGCLSRLLMLPNSDAGPSATSEPLVGVGVPTSIRLDLVRPPIGVNMRHRTMPWTAVPEATVDKHGQSQRRKHEVCPPAEAGQWRRVDEVTEAAPVQFTLESKLRRCISPPLILHPRQSGVGGSARTVQVSQETPHCSPRTICTKSTPVCALAAGTARGAVVSR